MTQPTLSPQEFVGKCRKAKFKERSGAQAQSIESCRPLEHPTAAEADPEGQRLTFEVEATTQWDGQGWADVWKKGFLAWEYKGKHADQ